MSDVVIEVLYGSPPQILPVEEETPVLVEVEIPGMQGVPGPLGPAGPQGPPGPSGGVDAVSFVWDQSTPSASWVITHNLGFFPNVTTVDSAGTEVEGVITPLSVTQLRIDFLSAFGGKAYLS